MDYVLEKSSLYIDTYVHIFMCIIMYYNNIKELKVASVHLLYISMCIYDIIPYGKATATPPIEVKWKRFPPGLAHSNQEFS